MTSLSAEDLVLVTGANGHVAQHVVDQLLQLPGAPRVRGTVRSKDKAELVRAHYSGTPAASRLELVVVNDMTADGTFDEGMKGVTHLVHVASPIVVSQDDIENDILLPAITGTTSALKSAIQAGTVKKVVVTSAFGAVADISQGWRAGYTYTEKDFNPFTRADALNTSLTLPNAVPILRKFLPYTTSKVLAERAAWDISLSPSCPFTLSVIVPTYIFGPSILPLTKGAESLSFSNKLVWGTATGGKEGNGHMDVDWPVMVDVRDVARAHVLALTEKKAEGERFIVNAESFVYSDIADIVKKHFPSLHPTEGSSQKFEHYGIDNSKSLDLLGLGSYIDLETSVVDTLKQLV